jgi:hypothetical protein
MKNSFLLFFLLLISFTQVSLKAQDDLEVFGYAQPYFNSYSSEYAEPGPPEGEENYKYYTMGVSQLNLFFKKGFGDDFSAFVNFEVVNNFSSDKGWGGFALQEAYLRWNYSDALKFKFGMLIPTFNQLYEIYNKTPLLPYVFRPQLYETNQGNLVDIFSFLPQKALVQASGVMNLGDVKFDYAAYLNYPTNGFFSSEDNDLLPGYVAFGQSAVTYLGVGGRLGFRYDKLNMGVSLGSDKENRRNYRQTVYHKYNFYLDDSTANVYATDETSLGDLNRFRLGFDLSFTFGGFTLSGEYLNVKTDIPAASQEILNQWNADDPYFIGKGFDKSFYYGSILYNISEKFFAYVMYDYMKDEADPFFFGENGYGGYSFGGGYNLNDYVVVKAQYVTHTAQYDVQEIDYNGNGIVEAKEDVRDFIDHWYALGISISF